jgi:hypothetical protein
MRRGRGGGGEGGTALPKMERGEREERGQQRGRWRQGERVSGGGREEKDQEGKDEIETSFLKG